MKYLIGLLFLSCQVMAQECPTQCAFEYATGQCEKVVSVPCEYFTTESSNVYCWMHGLKFNMWAKCLQFEDYTDSGCRHCDTTYGNASFDLREASYTVKGHKLLKLPLFE